MSILYFCEENIKSVVGAHGELCPRFLRYQERRHHRVQFGFGEFECVCLGVHIDILHEYPRLVKSLLEESPLTSPKAPPRLQSPASQAPPTLVCHTSVDTQTCCAIEHLFVPEGKPRGNTHRKLKKVKKTATLSATPSSSSLFFYSYFNLRWWIAQSWRSR